MHITGSDEPLKQPEPRQDQAPTPESLESSDEAQCGDQRREPSWHDDSSIHDPTNQHLGPVPTTCEEGQDHQRVILDGESHDVDLEFQVLACAKIINKLQRKINTTQTEAKEQYNALEEKHKVAFQALESGYKATLSVLQYNIGRRQDDLDDLLSGAASLLGHETDVGRFQSHLSDALHGSHAAEWQIKHANVVEEGAATKAKLQSAQVKVIELENNALRLTSLNKKMARDLEIALEKEEKNSRAVEELKEQVSAMQQRQLRLEKESSQKAELEKEVEDSKLKISMLEVQLADFKRRAKPHMASSISNSILKGGTDLKGLNCRSSYSEAVALPRFRMTPIGAAQDHFRSANMNTAESLTALPPPLSAFPQVPNRKLPSPDISSLPSRTSLSPDINFVIEEQESRIRNIEKRLFANKRLSASLEVAVSDTESSQTHAKQDAEFWKMRSQELEGELVSLKDQTQPADSCMASRVSLPMPNEEHNMRVHADRARKALEEQLTKLNWVNKKKKKGGLKCF